MKKTKLSSGARKSLIIMQSSPQRASSGFIPDVPAPGSLWEIYVAELRELVAAGLVTEVVTPEMEGHTNFTLSEMGQAYKVRLGGK